MRCINLRFIHLFTYLLTHLDTPLLSALLLSRLSFGDVQYICDVALHTVRVDNYVE